MTPRTWQRELLDQARDLKSEDSENPEYDRALVELVSRMLGFDYGSQWMVAEMLGIRVES